MSLIDSTYFINEFTIAGIMGTNPVATSNATKLQAIIDRREPQVLKDVLGATLYDEFIAGLAEVSPASKWTDLKAQLIDTSSKTATYTAIIYYWWLRATERMQNQTGNTEGIIPQVNTVSLAELYNDANEQLRDVQDWIGDHAADYTSYDGKILYDMNPLW